MTVSKIKWHLTRYSSHKKRIYSRCMAVKSLILRKIIFSVRNNFTNDEHVFLRILVTNLLVLCFDIYAIVYTVLSK